MIAVARSLAAIPDPALKQAWSRLLVACALSLLLHLALLLGMPVNPTGGAPDVVSTVYARIEPSAPAAAAADSETPAPETTRVPADKTPLPANGEAEPKPAETKAEPKPATASPTASSAGSGLPLFHDPNYYPARLLDVYPQPLTPIRLHYPATAAAERVDGRLLMLLLIDEAGVVNEASVVEAEPEGYFEEAARSVFRRARFSPGMQQGRAVKSRVLMQVKYVYGGNEGVVR